MPAWLPKTEWWLKDAFIIGGGASLTGFRWARLHGLPTIGCNSAFKLGSEVCSLCFFSDEEFFHANLDELEQYSGRVATHCEALATTHPWVLGLRRFEFGLHRDGLGFGGNSGASAVNLALLMGARRVFLLGFDCKRASDGRTHWHNEPVQGGRESAGLYEKFMEGFSAVAQDLPRVFPGHQVFNCSPDSNLKSFPQADLDVILPP